MPVLSRVFRSTGCWEIFTRVISSCRVHNVSMLMPKFEFSQFFPLFDVFLPLFAFLPGFLLGFLPGFLPSFLPSLLPSFLPSLLPSFRPPGRIGLCGSSTPPEPPEPLPKSPEPLESESTSRFTSERLSSPDDSA